MEWICRLGAIWLFGTGENYDRERERWWQLNCRRTWDFHHILLLLSLSTWPFNNLIISSSITWRKRESPYAHTQPRNLWSFYLSVAERIDSLSPTHPNKMNLIVEQNSILFPRLHVWRHTKTNFLINLKPNISLCGSFLQNNYESSLDV